ncbi:MAG: CDP-diacylglycerol--glycerol-3-phosphate 3-phosphatidyltransferase [Acidimicrobiia bacterium]
MTVPDALALARLLIVPVVVGFTVAGGTGNLVIAAVLFAAAAITDWFDGYLARRWEIESTLGAFLDTTADKLLVTGSLLGLVAIDRVSVWAALIIIFREMAVMGMRGLVAATGGMIRPSTWGKIKATAQFVAIFPAFLRLDQPWGPWYLDEWVMLVAVVATVASFWGYLVAFGGVVRAPRSGAKA